MEAKESQLPRGHCYVEQSGALLKESRGQGSSRNEEKQNHCKRHEREKAWTGLGHRKRSTADSKKRRREERGGGAGKRGENLIQREGRGNREGKEGSVGRKK